MARTGNRTGQYPTYYNKTLGKYIYTEDSVHEWKENSEMVKTMDTDGVHWWTMDDGRQSLYCNLRNSIGYWKGRCIVHSGAYSLQEGDRYPVSVFTRHLMLLMNKKSSVSNHVDSILKNKLIENLSERQSTALSPMLADILPVIGWFPYDTYLCFCLSQVTPEAYENMKMGNLTCSNIENRLPHCRSFFYNECIVVLVNLTSGNHNPEDVRMSIAYILRDGFFHMGISLPFHDLNKISLYYKQAYYALMGMERNSEIWYRQFSDCRIQYIADILNRDALVIELYDIALNKLKKYDEKNLTELFDTLKYYLMSERSIKQTSLHFKINRTTVNYRLKRIQDITQIDFEDPDERLLLNIMFRFRPHL